MTNLTTIAAAALMTTAIAATPALAQQPQPGNQGRVSAGAKSGASIGAGGSSATIRSSNRVATGPAPSMNNSATVRGPGNFAANGNFRSDRGPMQSGQFVASSGNAWNNSNWNNNWNNNWNGNRDFDRDNWRHRRDRDFSFGFGFSPGYYNPYYSDDYAYYDSYPYNDTYAYYGGDETYVSPTVGVDASYCARRYRSYDPASGTYLGFDGIRHPCP